MPNTLKALCAAALLSAAALLPLQAHELPANRLTLIQRDAGHLSLNFVLDYPAALHRALAAKQSDAEFLALSASLPLPELELMLAKAQAQFQMETQLRVVSEAKNAAPARISWRWPSAARVQQLLQQRVMEGLTRSPGLGGPSGRPSHAHPEVLEIQAECVWSAGLRPAATELQVQLPAAFERVLLVSYRPRQTWLETGESAQTVMIR